MSPVGRTSPANQVVLQGLKQIILKNTSFRLGQRRTGAPEPTQPGPHHRKAAEWAYMLYGNARITAVDAQGR